uniref:TNase-like domain-containing protein n=1 Tax=Neogobius melanostomus TaxID=47308 RepID=A0A8C6SZE3_9GOBI
MGGHICTQNVNNMPPESLAEDSRDGETDRQQRHEANQSSRNIVSLLSQLADDNLTLVRNLSTGLAVAGVIIIARSIKLMTKFHTASHIPVHFVEKNVSLYGKVHSVTERGLAVEHVPVYLPVISSLLHKKYNVCPSPSLLQVHLAGVELTPEGRQWLQENLLPAKMVWVKLISREDDVLSCLVSQNRGVLWTYCLNVELLRLGLARTAPISVLLPDSRLYWRLHRRLHRAEVKAKRKSLGLWKEDSFWERALNALRDNKVFSLIRRVFTKT